MAQRPEYEEDRSRVDVTLVNVQNCWIMGAERAAATLRAFRPAGSPFYDADAVDWDRMDEQGIDMFRPFGEFVGLNDAGAGAADDEEGEDSQRAGLDAGGSVESMDDDQDVHDVEAALEEICSVDRKQRTVLDANNQPVSLEAACRAVRSSKKKTTESPRLAS